MTTPTHRRATHAETARTHTHKSTKEFKTETVVKVLVNPLPDAATAHEAAKFNPENGDSEILERAQLKKWGGTRHNTALAEAAEIEDRNEDVILGHFSELSYSPMFVAAAESYKERGSDWDLVLFASRLFYAGVLAGRNEAGRRDKEGNLLLDAPYDRGESDSIVVHPTMAVTQA